MCFVLAFSCVARRSSNTHGCCPPTCSQAANGLTVLSYTPFTQQPEPGCFWHAILQRFASLAVGRTPAVLLSNTLAVHAAASFGCFLVLNLTTPVDIEPRCGTCRPSMETNVLIAKTQLGKVR